MRHSVSNLRGIEGQRGAVTGGVVGAALAALGNASFVYAAQARASPRPRKPSHDAIAVGAALAALGRGLRVYAAQARASPRPRKPSHDAIAVGAALAALGRGLRVYAAQTRASPRPRKQTPTNANASTRGAARRSNMGMRSAKELQ